MRRIHGRRWQTNTNSVPLELESEERPPSSDLRIFVLFSKLALLSSYFCFLFGATPSYLIIIKMISISNMIILSFEGLYSLIRYAQMTNVPSSQLLFVKTH